MLQNILIKTILIFKWEQCILFRETSASLRIMCSLDKQKSHEGMCSIRYYELLIEIDKKLNIWKENKANQSAAGSIVLATCRIMHPLFKVIAYIENITKLLSYMLPYRCNCPLLCKILLCVKSGLVLWYGIVCELCIHLYAVNTNTQALVQVCSPLFVY